MTNYTDVTLVNRGTTSGQTILTASDVNISGHPAGSTMVWKVACNNLSSAKSTRIHGVSLGWSLFFTRLQILLIAEKDLESLIWLLLRISK